MLLNINLKERSSILRMKIFTQKLSDKSDLKTFLPKKNETLYKVSIDTN